MSITSNGYVCVPRCVDERALCALRLEANHLFRLKKAQDSLSEDEYFDKVRLTDIQVAGGSVSGFGHRHTCTRNATEV